jgi:hypothetical protein
MTRSVLAVSDKDTDNTDRIDKTISLAAGGLDWDLESELDSEPVLLLGQAQDSEYRPASGLALESECRLALGLEWGWETDSVQESGSAPVVRASLAEPELLSG